jgi:uncharacterized membrane protein YgcG
MSPTAGQRPLRDDPRTADVAAREVVPLPLGKAHALLRALGPRERVLALYHQGLGYAALTEDALILLNGEAPARVARPLVILRPAYGAASRVDVSANGRRITVWGSVIDVSGELLRGTGTAVPVSYGDDPSLGELLGERAELLSAGSSPRPRRAARLSAWARRRPVLASFVAVATAAAVWGAGHETPVRAGAVSVTVSDFRGKTLGTAVAHARRQSWRTVTTTDASSAHRPVRASESGWRVCFQTPSRGATARPATGTLTLYAVPEKETCPARALDPRRAVVPDVVGKRFDEAAQVLAGVGIDYPARRHAHTGRYLDGSSHDVDDWRVCRQDPEPGREDALPIPTGLWLIGPGGPCARPSPKPAPKPKPKPKPKPRSESKPGTGGTSGSGTSGGTSGGGTGGGASSGGSSGGSSGTSGGTTGGTGGRSGIGFGQYCSPVGAVTTTADGRPAKCFMGKDGNARWGYDSG